MTFGDASGAVRCKSGDTSQDIQQGRELLQHLRRILLPAAVVLVFCGFATAVALTKRPWCDEGWFASIAYNLIHRGVMGLTVLDPRGFVFAPEVKAIDRYTYWVLPNYLLLQAVWCSILGLSTFTFRLLSVVWGSVALFSWYYVVRALTRNRPVAVISALILALDQHFIVAGASGRMDMMCAALNLAASAIYLRLRDRFHLAVFVACCVLAAALMTHPNAVFGAVLLAIIAISLDASRLRWRTVPIAAAPFLAALALWSAYVLQAPDVFVAQMQAQASIPHRLEIDWNLVRHFSRELRARFASSYNLRSAGPLRMATGVVLFLYFGAVFALAAVKKIRVLPGSRPVLWYAIASFSLLSCLQDNWYYLVYILPAFAGAAAICIVWLWERRSNLARLAAAAAGFTVLLNVAVPCFRIVHNDYRSRYSAAVNYLRQNANPGDLIMGSGELAFDLGFDGRVIDDCRLGFYGGRLPAYIVLEGQYYQFWFPWLSTHEPETFRHIKKVLDEEFDIAYDQRHDSFVTFGTSDLPYRIYKRKSGK